MRGVTGSAAIDAIEYRDHDFVDRDHSAERLWLDPEDDRRADHGRG